MAGGSVKGQNGQTGEKTIRGEVSALTISPTRSNTPPGLKERKDTSMVSTQSAEGKEMVT